MTEEAVDARLQASLLQPGYGELFPAPRQRWVDDLSLSAEELAAIAVPVLLVHGTRDRVVPLRDGALAWSTRCPTRGLICSVAPAMPRRSSARMSSTGWWGRS